MKPRATKFVFRSFRFSPKLKTASFFYRIEFRDRPPLDFTETISFPGEPRKLPAATLKKFLEPLHLILGISYYKLYCPPKIEVAFPLNREQAAFWNKVYRKGLGEFLYKNNLDPASLAKFPISRSAPAAPVRLATGDGILLGIGGGKDSIVAAELLRGQPVTSWLVETQREDPLTRRVMEAVGYPELVIRRTLDPKIFAPHEGAYNGHVPISAVFSFLGLLTAALYGQRHVVVGNEQSSNFGNLEYHGEEINHQWSKSAEYEAMVQDYCRRFMTSDITYFSLLRQFYEIRIARMFARHRRYLRLFTSCNRNFRVNRGRPATLWCGECPKCAFMFLMLAPFVGKRELIGVFGKNLLADPALASLFRDLLGFGEAKPFDCVGTFDEARAALFLASAKFGGEATVRKYLPLIENPEELVKLVFRSVPAPTLPTPFRFLGVRNVGLLGFGREGKATRKYLRQNYPNLKVGILDEKLGKDYLARQADYDLLVKTPGIPKGKVTVPYVTATNMFFAANRNLKVGVTGSKGKSTTTTLIYEILKADGEKVRLLGNIGSPMIGALLTPIEPDEIFVLELSSYMLDDIEYAPNIAVLLNLFPEHMDYHGGLENYYAAKRNIFKFQKPGDVAVLPPHAAPVPLKRGEIPLAGPHNYCNVQAAVRVARLMGVGDAAIRRAVMNFRPLPHRLELVGTHRGISFYDDAISTAPESTIMALKSLRNVGTIFLGGTDRGYDFRKLEAALRTAGVRNVVLFPDSGRRILKSRRGFRVLETASMKEAVEFAFRHTEPDQVCLLSTASPSYSLWKNFEAKGQDFKRCVQEVTS
jgi:UDP-N-acetylmuramoylalanine-D-glutamate ligase